MMTKKYQTGAWNLAKETPEGTRILRADNCPTAPAGLRRGRDQGYLAYATQEEAANAARDIAAWELAMQADDRRRTGRTNTLYFQGYTPIFNQNEVVLVDA